MSPLVWLAIPLVALVLATVWVGIASRPKPRADTHETVQAHQRFVKAFESRPQQTRRPHPPAGHSDQTHRKSA